MTREFIDLLTSFETKHQSSERKLL